jgi:hypothetical protein
MPTLPQDALRLAKQLAEEARLEEDARAAAEFAAMAYPIAPVETPFIKVPMFLHERELRMRFSIVTLLASGRNPFQPGSLERMSEAQQLDVLRSLAVVACTLASAHERRSPPPVEQFPDTSDPAAKRPLEEYMRRVEKQAILEALEETHYNRTEAARLLGITFRALRYKLESLGIDV